MTRRQPIKALNKDVATVAANAATEKARKAASRKALRDAIDTKQVTEADLIKAAKHLEETPVLTQNARNLEAAAIEADATGMSFEEACESMGVDPTTGAPVVAEKQRYQGPMLALVAARKAYIKTANGNPCNGDPLALALGSLSREDVCRVCIKALGLPNNPYTHLNPGQQSMNLRNKLRHAIKQGFVTMADVEAAK